MLSLARSCWMFSTLLLSGTAAAFDCSDVAITFRLEHAAVVLVGTVREVRSWGLGPEWDKIVADAVIIVDRSWKGPYRHGDLITTDTACGGVGCGVVPTVGDTIVLFSDSVRPVMMQHCWAFTGEDARRFVAALDQEDP